MNEILETATFIDARDYLSSPPLWKLASRDLLIAIRYLAFISTTGQSVSFLNIHLDLALLPFPFPPIFRLLADTQIIFCSLAAATAWSYYCQSSAQILNLCRVSISRELYSSNHPWLSRGQSGKVDAGNMEHGKGPTDKILTCPLIQSASWNLERSLSIRLGC